jgi:hypothetical protein
LKKRTKKLLLSGAVVAARWRHHGTKGRKVFLLLFLQKKEDSS